MLTNGTKRLIDTARDILVGKMPDPKSQVEQITIALIYKFMDDMDKQSEELGGKTKFFTGEYAKYAWSKIFDPRVSGHELVGLYGDALQRMNHNPNIPQLFRDIFKNAYLPYRDPETLKSFLKAIGEFEYDHSEKLGDAFEYLLSVMGSQGDAGQFRTPRHIIDFIVKVVDPRKNETILDPACGTAGFLISAYKHILEKNKKDGRVHLTPAQKKRLIENFSGYDISPDMVRLSLVNMYLHGFKNPKIYEYDTLTSEEKWQEVFDVILANPPFMSPKGGIRPHKRFSVQAKRSEVLFVDYMAEHLNPNGRAGIIVPEGIIFQLGTAYKKLRKMLVDHSLYAVVSLPAGVFNPYSGVKTSILMLDKNLVKKIDKILFVKINNDGFGLGAQRRKVKGSDLPMILGIIGRYKQSIAGKKEFEFSADEAKLAFLVNKEKIAESGDYNLIGDRYKKTIIYSGKWDFVELGELERQGEIEFLRGQGLSKNDINDNGMNKCIHYGELYTLYQPIIERVISKTDFDGKVLSISGDVLVPSTTTADAMGIAIARALNEDGVVLGGDINIIRTRNNKINSRFLSLLLNFPLKKELSTYAKGVNILHISNKDIKQIKIPMVPLEVQEQIVAESDNYQKVIDGARQVVENYRPTFKINPDWEIVDLGELINFVSGLTLSIPECEDKNGTPILAINNVTASGEITLNGLRKIRLPKKKTINFVRQGDLLFNWRNGSKHLVGKTAYFDLDGKYVFASFLIGIRTKREVLEPKYLWYLLNSYRKDGKYMQFMRQNVNGLFNREELKILKIHLPSLTKQREIVSQFERERKLVETTKDLITLFEQKIKDKISDVWGEK